MEISRLLEVSRTPVQEAIRRLASEGFVENSVGKKARVHQFTPREIEEIYEMRELLECRAVRKAAGELTDQQLKVIEREAELLKDLEVNEENQEKMLEFDILFHEIIASACGNDRLEKEIANYRLLVRVFCRISGTFDNLKSAFEEHLEIIQALKKRNPGKAEKAMKEHIQSRKRQVLKMI